MGRAVGTGVHAGTFFDRLQAFEDGNAGFAVLVVFSHRGRGRLKGRTTLSDDLKALCFVVLSVIKRQARGKVFVAFHAAQEAGGEFFQCPQVNVAFKINHFVNGSPILVPTPAVKFGMVAGAQIDVAVASDQPQKIPICFCPRYEPRHSRRTQWLGTS